MVTPIHRILVITHKPPLSPRVVIRSNLSNGRRNGRELSLSMGRRFIVATKESGLMTFTLYHRAETRARWLFILIGDDIRYRFRFIQNPIRKSVIRPVPLDWMKIEDLILPCFRSKSDSTRSCLTRVTIEKENGKKCIYIYINRLVGCVSVAWMDVDARWIDIIG